MTVNEQRTEILGFLVKVTEALRFEREKYGYTENGGLYGGYRFICELEDEIIKVRGNAKDYDKIIRRMAEQGYIRISKSGTQYKVLKTK